MDDIPPILITTATLSRLAEVHHTKIARLISQGELCVAAFVEEQEKRQPLFVPIIAIAQIARALERQKLQTQPAVLAEIH